MSEKELKEFEEKLRDIKAKEDALPIIEKPPEEEPEEELYEDDDELVTEAEVVKNTKPKEDNYSDLVEEMPELKEDLDYLLITKKLKQGKSLTKKEQQFKRGYEEAKEKEAAFQEAVNKKMEEEKERQELMQEQINKEYEEHKKAHPEQIEKVDSSKNLSLTGADNFLRIALTWMKLIKSKKKGGKIFVKVSRPKKVSFEWTTKDIRFVEFWSVNERGDMVKEVTRVSQYNYTFNGTSIPVIFAIQGYAESWDFYSEFKKDLSSEFVSGLVMEAYNLGYKDGLVLSDSSKKPDMFDSLNKYLPIIILVIMGIVAYLCYSIYQDNTQILNALEAIKTQAVATTNPIVVS